MSRPRYVTIATHELLTICAAARRYLEEERMNHNDGETPEAELAELEELLDIWEA